MSFSKGSIVLDNGSGYIKVGLAGHDVPSSTFSSTVRSTKHNGLDRYDVMFKSEQPLAEGSLSTVIRPISHGIVTNWDSMERLWSHAIYKELKTLPEKQPILLTEPPLNPKANREKMIELMFEKFGFPGIFVQNTAVLSAYCAARTNCVVIESGDDLSCTVPVYDGYSLHDAISKLDFAGRTLTEYLFKILAEGGHVLSEECKKFVAQDVKHRFGFVAQDFDAELNYARGVSRSYRLPDGNTIIIEDERFRCPEPLFKPCLIGNESPGIHEALFQSIMKCKLEIRNDLYENMILSGKTTLFQGFGNRIVKEMKLLAPENSLLNILDQPQRGLAPWIGGSIMANISAFEQMWITKQEYDEFGPIMVHRKCT